MINSLGVKTVIILSFPVLLSGGYLINSSNAASEVTDEQKKETAASSLRPFCEGDFFSISKHSDKYCSEKVTVLLPKIITLLDNILPKVAEKYSTGTHASRAEVYTKFLILEAKLYTLLTEIGTKTFNPRGHYGTVDETYFKQRLVTKVAYMYVYNFKDSLADIAGK